MLKNFNTKLLNKYDNLLLAISGGIDSMVLLHVLNNIAESMNLNLMVAHVDHQKRLTSSKDLAFVKETCDKLKIPFVSKILNYKDNDNFHNYARTLRYEFFYNVAKENNMDKLVLAHNQNDNAETILMRLTRGSSFEGYRGILEVANYKNLPVIRPMLGISRQDISDYQKEYKVNYREDESNAKDNYTRNRFRHNILPLLKNENPKYLNKISQFSEYMSFAYELIEKTALQFINDNLLYEKTVHIISCKSILSLDRILQIEVAKRIINIHTDNSIELSYQNITDILSLIKNEKPHLELKLSTDLYIYKSYDNLYIQSSPNVISDYEIIIDSLSEISLPNKQFLIITKNQSKYSGNIYKLCYNNLDQIFPLTIRNRRAGDRLKTPAGTKKIKDIFIDKKVPKSERDSLPVVLDRNNEIIWIPNYFTKNCNGDEAIYLIYKKE